MARISIPVKLAREVYGKTNGFCFYCKCKLQKDTNFYDDGGKIVVTKRNWHVDHVIPVCKGGSNQIENLVPSCPQCNMKKGAK